MLQSSENSVVVTTENNSFWSIMHEAVFGSRRDFTTGSIGWTAKTVARKLANLKAETGA